MDGLWLWQAQNQLRKYHLGTLASSLNVVTLVLTERSHGDIPICKENWFLKINANNKYHHDHDNLSGVTTNTLLLLFSH